MVFIKSPLTNTFSFESFEYPKGTYLPRFPKPTPKKKKTMLDYAKKQRLMPYKAGKKKSKPKLPSISSLKTRANKVFGDFIKNRDNWTCVLCGKTKENVTITNGHLIKRGKKIHLFSELNCHALCTGCNKLDNYDHDIYVNWFIRKYGLEAYQKLFDTKETLFQIKRYFLLEIIKKYT